MSVYEDTDVKEYETEESFLNRKDACLLAGNEIEEIIFPDTVEEIGRYIFYGCKNFKRLEFSDSLMYLGSGAFTGCGKLCELTVHLHHGKKSCVKEILGGLWQRIDVTFYRESSCAKDTSARILFTQHHGIGNNYRQCFYNKEMDYRKYDELFPLAVAQEGVELLTDLVFCRLKMKV